MTRRLLRFAILAALLLCRPLPASAAIISIDFDALSDGDDLSTLLGLGVAFSNAVVATEGISLNEFDFPAHSGTNVIIDTGLMRLDFSTSISSFSGYFTYTSPLTIQFFGASGLLGSTTSLFSENYVSSGGSPNELLSGAFENISYLTIAGAFAGSFTLDDVTFDTVDTSSVPEPSTFALIGIGVVALAGYRRSKRVDPRTH